MRILLAMSGGIDSSVVAHMLAGQGHELIGVRFTLWSDPLAPPLAQILPSKCCNTQTASRAKTVAAELKIPLHIIDLEQEFKQSVVDPFLAGYKQGLTPNPCIGCNRSIKFGKLIELADQFGCEKLATGHYARIALERLTDGSNRSILLEALDATKDQSYYLYGVDQSALSRVLFPLGGMLKEDVFALAKAYGVPLPEGYKESQDLCFFPEKQPKEFLKRHLRDSLTPGPIVRRDGVVVGTHEGLPLYTIGQRRGLKIGGLKVPLEVVAKDSAHNSLIVSTKGSEMIESVTLQSVRFLSWSPEPNVPVSFEYRNRSLCPKKRGRLEFSGTTGSFFFDSPQPPQAPGQSIVLYRGQEVVGGGVIA
ncbi:MAG: tRNA 2-thiouridine(34) synthase MnmA [Candidatus Peribacteraceae bacterium]|nr:tRNA 2-thiouridine(34) synthase MnmA [Candidatus Peribacteraceae bacterium]